MESFSIQEKEEGGGEGSEEAKETVGDEGER